jgi:hypothetical protein
MKFQRGDRVLVRVPATCVSEFDVRPPIGYYNQRPRPEGPFVDEPAVILRTFGSEPDVSVMFERTKLDPDELEDDGLPSFGAVIKGDDIMPAHLVKKS